MKRPIYMDHHATTPLDPRVLDAMLPFLTEQFGNAASRSHVFGWRAEEAVDRAREQVAALLHAAPREIIFTSGATEANNLALKGAAAQYAGKGNHLITQATEHPAVLDPCAALERQGFAVTVLPVDRDGLVDPEQVANAITDRTILISIMAANNEIGVLQPVEAIGSIAKARGVLFHCDATQAVGREPVDVEALGADLLSLSAHKLYGPKGIGALYVRRRNPRVRLVSQMDGGGHERGFRSGTLNVPGVVGCGAACAIARQEMDGERERLGALRERLRARIFAELDEVYLNGHPTRRLANNLNVAFAYVEGESLLMSLKEIALSSGSACTSASLKPSHVLAALGLGEELAHTSLRFGLGRFNTAEEVDYVAAQVVEKVRELRELSPLYEPTPPGPRAARGKRGTGEIVVSS